MDDKQRPGDHIEDIWGQLSKDISIPAALENGLGLWGEILTKPSGLWKNVDEETIRLNRQHKQTNIWQKSAKETILVRRKEELNIFNFVAEQLHRAKTKTPAEKINLWDELGEETIILPRTEKSLPRIRDVSKTKPVRIKGWALKKLETTKGETYWVLKNLDLGSYLKLNEQQAHLWELMDGQHTVQDLAVEMFLKYKTLAIGGLMEFIDQLEDHKLLIHPAVDVYQASRAEIERKSIIFYLKKGLRSFFKSEFSFKNVDKFYALFYQRIGRVLFWPPMIGLIILISILGLPAYVALTLRGELSILGNSRTFGFGLVSLYLAQLFAIFCHESAHALTTKHYGRTVRQGGVGLYFGLVAFFMDTTDIWMEPRKPRLAVTWAGPIAGLVLGGISSLLLLVSPVTTWAGFLYQFATFCIIGTILNLNPLLKYDGYYILMDWLEIPRLRERSFNFVRHQLRKKVKEGQKLTREEKIFTIYGFSATVFTCFILISVILLYGDHFQRFFSMISALFN